MNGLALIHHLGQWSAGKGSLQNKPAGALARAISDGALNPGLRLPSERSLAQALSVSRTTVVAAYDSLRERGWVESRSGSGTRVSARSSVVTAARQAIQMGALATSPLLGILTHEQGPEMIDFAHRATSPLTELSSELFTIPPDEYGAIFEDARYYPLGLTPLRQAIADYYTQQGFRTAKEQVIVTTGAQQAITLCAAHFLQRGDTVLIEDPAYFGALDAFRSVGARILPLPVESNGVSASVIRDRVTASAARLVYITPTFQNPTGRVIPRSARKEICKIASELGVPIIDDGTLADLIIDGPSLPPLSADSPDAPVLTIGSISKLICSGLRVGWVRASEPMIQRLARLKSAMDLASPPLTQSIAVRLLHATDEARRLRGLQLKPRRDLVVSFLHRHLPKWKFWVPSGGLFLWVQLPSGDAREFAQVALRHGVVVLPGTVMSTSEAHVRFIRLPFLGSPETLRAGLTRLRNAWQDYESHHRRVNREAMALI